MTIIGLNDYNTETLKTRVCHYCQEVKTDCIKQIIALNLYNLQEKNVCRSCYKIHWREIH